MEIKEINGYILVEKTKDSKSIKESGKNDNLIMKWLGEIIKKNEGSVFNCPIETVLVGRKHSGDENGNSSYRYGKPVLVLVEDSTIFDIIHPSVLVTSEKSSDSQKESECNINCDLSNFEVFTGRMHKGDENGYTTFAISQLQIDSKRLIKTEVSASSETVIIDKESNGEWAEKIIEIRGKKYNLLMTGFEHHGDENKPTTYTFTKYTVKIYV